MATAKRKALDAAEDAVETLVEGGNRAKSRAQAGARRAKAAAREAAVDLADAAEETVGGLQGTVSDLREAAANKAHDLGERVASTAAHLRDGASDRAADLRDTLTDSGDRLAASLRRAADQAPGGEVPRRVLSTAADGVALASDRLRGSTLADVGEGIRQSMRRNPALYAAGAALAGFVIARMMAPPSDPDSEA